jgi:O-antigen biosynthesis protein
VMRNQLYSRLLLMISVVLKPISLNASERFVRSAKKRDPKRETFYDFDYPLIVEAWEKQRSHDHKRYNALADKLKDGPLISVVVPVYNTDPRLLNEMIASVCNQRYRNWELCIADDASSDAAVRPVLEKAARDDSRIKVVFRQTNGHISLATNSALELATGQFAAFLDHDDLLDPDALLHVAFEISRNPDVKILYTDEDVIAVDGKRYGPHFKPAWNRELLYGMNYACHFLVCEMDLVSSVGGLRAGFEGAQDHDLLLRCVAQVADDQICHIAKVLYHWRASPGSVAESGANKPYATDAGLRAMAEHLRMTTGDDIAVVQGKVPFTYVPRWPLKHAPKVSIIIPTRDRLELLRVAIESILTKTSYPDFEIIIVDNGSKAPETLQWIDQTAASHAAVRVVRDDREFNYSALNNFAVANAKGTVLAFLNNDIEVISPHWLTEMTSLAIRSDVGCVGAKLYYPNDTIQHAGVVAGMLGGAAHAFRNFPRDHPGYAARLFTRQEYLAVTGACLVIRRSVFEEVGGFNETDLAIAFNDVDLCLKVHAAGYRNIWTPHAELYHHESASRGLDNTPQKMERFAREFGYLDRRWKIANCEDPAYNPNLSKTSENFCFGPPVWRFPAAMPPRFGRSFLNGKS